MNEPLFEVKSLYKSYKDKCVVDDVSYSVNKGELVGLLGTNGAGKTTSFRIAVGLVRPDEGNVFLAGEDITKDPIHIRARKGLGYLAQEQTIFRDLTVYENLVAILEMLNVPKKERIESTDAMIEEIGLKEHTTKLAKNLSGGLRRRLEIARTLLLKPKILLLDEPFAGLDPKVVGDLQELISNLTTLDIGILITDHKVRETLEVTHRAYIMHDGIILKHGKPDELIHDERVIQVYLGNSFEDQYGENGTSPRINRLGRKGETEYFATRYSDRVLANLPWDDAEFGCVLFCSSEEADPRLFGAAAGVLAGAKTSWLKIAGRHGRFMHNLVRVTSDALPGESQVELVEDKDSFEDLPELISTSEDANVLLIVVDDDENYQRAVDLLSGSFAEDEQDSIQ
jgi:lipopolysaccharide export system ATP-binding protein